MAHLRSIWIRTCAEHGCHAKATQTLYGNRNSEYGSYCNKHAAKALKRQEEYEKRGTSVG